MSPRWLLSVCLILLLVAPVPVSPQATLIIRVMKAALCSVCSATFVFRGCAPREVPFCRMIAFKMSVLCNTYPCINYGAPRERSCGGFPLTCPIWNIRPLGLCEAGQVCCTTGGFIEHRGFLGPARSSLRNARRKFKPVKSVLAKLPITLGNLKASENVLSSQPDSNQLLSEEVLSYLNHTELYIPSTPEEYSKDWPQTDLDPTSMELAIVEQYEKFLTELTAINKQETEMGHKPVRVPSFEEFRSAALGENHV